MVYARLIALGAIWGSSFLAQKIALQAYTYQQIVLGRMFFAACVLSAAMIVRRGRFPTSRQFWFRVGVSGTLIALGNILVPFALVTTASGLSGVLMATIPLFTVASALVLLRHERPTLSQSIGLLIGFAGAVIAIEPWRKGGTGAATGGVAALLIAAALLGLNSGYTRRFLSSRPEGGLVMMAAAMVAGWVVLMALVVPIVVPQSWPVSPQPMLAVLYLGAVPTGLAYILLFGLIRDVGVTRASTANYLIPVVAVALGAAALHEMLRWTLVIGGLLVLSGVALSDGRLQVGARAGRGRSRPAGRTVGERPGDHRVDAGSR